MPKPEPPPRGEPPATSPRSVELVPRLGLTSTTLSGIGIILGAGIFVVIGEAAREAGSAVWLSFLIAAVLAGATGVSYAELAGMFPQAGASPIWVQEAFGSRAGFLVGWLRLAISVISGAAVALGFSSYLAALVGWPTLPVTVAVLAGACAVVIIGVRATVGLAVAMTLITTAGLALVVIVGAGDIGSRSLLETPRGAGGVIVGAALLFFAYEGFEQIATLSEETRDPARTIPRAILWSLAVTTGIYLLVGITAVSVLDWRTLANSASPLAEVAQTAAGTAAADALAAVALFATFNTVLMMIATASRRAYGMARRGLLSPIFAVLGPWRRTPWVSATVVTAAAVLLAVIGDLRFAVEASNLAVFVAFFVVDATVVWLRVKRPNAPRPFRAPLAIRGIPLLPLVGGLGAAGLALTSELGAVVAVLVVLGIGVVLTPIALRRAAGEPQ